MSSTAIDLAAGVAEDPLALLPRKPVRDYDKHQVIYGAGSEPEGGAAALYLVIGGRVKVSRPVPGGGEVILGFHHTDEFFGESRLWSAEQGSREQAAAMGKTSLMQWSDEELDRLMIRMPALGPALLRVLTRKLADAGSRIESFCLDPIPRRLVKTLLELGRSSGRAVDERGLQLPPTTHEQLASYVGTSREIITQYLNRLRRQGLLSYSRRGLELDVAGLEQFLAG